MQYHVQRIAGPLHGFCHRDVFFRRRRIAGGVVVDEDER